MKTTGLSYEEAKDLLLHGYKVKLPKWKGYWVIKNNEVEVHTKEGEILTTPKVVYTFCDNWEVATVDNCPVLKREIEESNNKEKQFKVIDTITIKDINSNNVLLVVVQKENEEDNLMILTRPELKEIFGGKKAKDMINEYAYAQLEKVKAKLSFY